VVRRRGGPGRLRVCDYPLIAFHYEKANTVSDAVIPVFYAVAMGASGVGSLVFGRWFDARGLIVLVPGLIISAAVAPLVFFGGFTPGTHRHAAVGCVARRA
jgi:hypothetical protein